MATTVRPEVSYNNNYWISRHRYYELKHFCLQYPLWKRYLSSVDGFGNRPSFPIAAPDKTGAHGDPTALRAMERDSYQRKMAMVEKAAYSADPEIGRYILMAVTEGHSFNYLKSRLEIPCSKDTYYDLYRKFFWLLSQERD